MNDGANAMDAGDDGGEVDDDMNVDDDENDDMAMGFVEDLVEEDLEEELNKIE